MSNIHPIMQNIVSRHLPGIGDLTAPTGHHLDPTTDYDKDADAEEAIARDPFEAWMDAVDAAGPLMERSIAQMLRDGEYLLAGEALARLAEYYEQKRIQKALEAA